MEKDKTSEFLTKEQIIAASQETLRRFGVAKTSVTDVAKLLGVSHGTIYRHYKSKKELLEGVTAQWLEDEIIAPLTAITKDQSYSGEGIRHLKVYIEALIRLKRYYAESDAELFEMYARVTQESAEIIDKHVQHLIRHLREIIQQDNQFKFSNPDVVAKAILQATARFHHPAHAYEWLSPTIDAEFAQVWLLLEKGLLHLDQERE
ncbi:MULTISPECIES: TetR/AcrR family transcriptional regulator [Paenibacillus]|uniref:TetR/AcrR family transcriptional regulator n=1 Tax=Paenibacillus TaxID=44249 RepID=UPI000410F9EB|nr:MULTISPECIES: TetR family transcriptional regulator [Paenibacillus]KGP81807.1 TetR family transcriptional regulator [Paenibacillus sp. MAEPY2]KGP86650.1 TetR family transcriptional regulator [Paenibacillus sp. MAEPY1]OZQ63494.1 TetR family transcriptional regulator [Paenibacillus taichungensis]HBU85574.1 TetR/AcrR family transcriptional regulator [Paenibacillus sp.]